MFILSSGEGSGIITCGTAFVIGEGVTWGRADVDGTFGVDGGFMSRFGDGWSVTGSVLIWGACAWKLDCPSVFEVS